MVKPHQLFFRSLVLLSLALAHPSPAHANGPVMAGVAGPGVNLIYAYLAQDAGMWKKHGLDVRVVLFESGSTLAQVARTGEVKFAINSGPGTIAARTQGADAVIVAAVVNTVWSLRRESPNGPISREKKSASAASGQAPTRPFVWCARNSASTPLETSSSCKGVLSRAAYRLYRWAPWMPRWYPRPWI